MLWNFSFSTDFTPSCGNTPLHHRFPAETPRTSRVSVASADNEASNFNLPPLPTKRRKKLADLFRESLGNEASFAFLNQEENRKADEPRVSGTDSVCNSERTAGDGINQLVDENPIELDSKMCCLPPLASRSSSRERKEDLKLINGVSWALNRWVPSAIDNVNIYYYNRSQFVIFWMIGWSNSNKKIIIFLDLKSIEIHIVEMCSC